MRYTGVVSFHKKVDKSRHIVLTITVDEEGLHARKGKNKKKRKQKQKKKQTKCTVVMTA